MPEKIPGFTPEEQKKYSERGGYVSGQSRRGEIQRGESGGWELTEKGKETLREKALEEDTAREKELVAQKKAEEADISAWESEGGASAPSADQVRVEAASGKEKEFIPGPAVEREEKKEKPEGKEEIPEELKNAYFEWRDLERKAKKLWMPDESSWDAATLAKEKYHRLLIEKSEVSEKEKPFYLPEEMAPEGGPQKYNLERLERIVGMELGLQKEYEKGVSAESKENGGIFKKLWRNYSKLPQSTKIALGVGIATGAFIYTAPVVGLWLVGATAGTKLARSLVGGFVAGLVYKGLDKFVTPFVDRAAQKNIEKMKLEQAKMFNDIKISGVQKELLFAKENMIREHARIARQKQRINIEKALIAGAVGVASSFGDKIYESAFEKPPGGGVLPPESDGRVIPPADQEVAGVPPVAGKVSENLIQQEQYFGAIDRGGNIWKTAREIAGQAGLDDKQFGESWHNSFVDIPGRGRVHISEVNLVRPGTEVYWDGETEAFYVKGEGMGPTKVFYGEPQLPTETAPKGRPFEHIPVETPEAQKVPIFSELEKGYPGVDADKFVSDRLESFNIDPDYYDKIKNSKVSELLKIRQGTFWDLFRHLNNETAGQVDIHAEWKLAVMVKTELKNLLPMVENKTVDEALKFAAQNRSLIK